MRGRRDGPVELPFALCPVVHCRPKPLRYAMNERAMNSAKPDTRRHRVDTDKDIRRFGLGLLIGCGVLAGGSCVYLFIVLNTMMSPHESTDVADVVWSEDEGEPYVVRVTVSDAGGKPVPAAQVHVDNNSGGSYGTTDEAGTATLEMGEADFSGLQINNVRVVARPHAHWLGSPNVMNGLNVEVRLK